MTKIYPPLYKRTSADKIQVWFLEQDGPRFRATYGQRGGTMTQAAWTVCEPKNVGKRNEISAEKQATKEIEAQYKKKRRQDFFDDVNAIDNKMRFKPMLAEPLAKVVDSIPDEEIVGYQPKLDGFRCIATNSGLFTRDGLPIPTAPHIVRALAPLFSRFGNLILDGELYNHDLHDDFNTISSVLRKKKPSIADLLRSEELVEYHIYDIPSFDANFFRRNEYLVELLTDHVIREIGDSTPLRIVPTEFAPFSQASDRLIGYLNDKYEGGIARRDAPYANKRTKNLIKIKKFLEEEFQLIRLEEGVGKHAGMAARAILQLKDGREFSAGLIGDHDYCRELFNNQKDVIGQMCTVQFLNYTPAGKPRGGKLKTVRWA